MKPRYWVISDAHMYQPGMSWDGRPEDHTERTLHNVRARIEPGDTLIDLGDTVWSRLPGAEQRRALLQLREAAGGRLIKVRGNHDTFSDASYLELGIISVQSLVISDIYFSHLGAQTLPDDARMQVLGHYHRHAPNPLLPCALRFSLTDEGFAPVTTGELKRRGEAMGLMRPLPQRVDDRWYQHQPVA